MTEGRDEWADPLVQMKEEIEKIIAKFPGWEPGSLVLQPAMVPLPTLWKWRKAFASLEAERRRVEEVAKEMEEFARLGLGPQVQTKGNIGEWAERLREGRDMIGTATEKP